MRSIGTNDTAYTYTPASKITNAIISNPVDDSLVIGDKPSDICENWSNNESGVFTPVAGFITSGDFSPTVSSANGQYRRIGDIVYFNLFISLNTESYTTASGNFYVSGLPYSAISYPSFFQQTANVGAFTNIAIGAGRTLESYVTSERVEFRRSREDGSHGSVTEAQVLPNTVVELNISGTYFV